MNNAFEALYTGVYIVIFITAVTITLYLFRNINELAENSYEYGISNSDATLIQEPTDTNRYLNSGQVISYYFNYVARDIYAYVEDENDSKKRTKPDSDFIVNIYDKKGQPLGDSLSYTVLKGKLGNNETYIIKYVGIDDASKKDKFEIRCNS